MLGVRGVDSQARRTVGGRRRVGTDDEMVVVARLTERARGTVGTAKDLQDEAFDVELPSEQLPRSYFREGQGLGVGRRVDGKLATRARTGGEQEQENEEERAT